MQVEALGNGATIFASCLAIDSRPATMDLRCVITTNKTTKSTVATDVSITIADAISFDPLTKKPLLDSIKSITARVGVFNSKDLKLFMPNGKVYKAQVTWSSVSFHARALASLRPAARRCLRHARALAPLRPHHRYLTTRPSTIRSTCAPRKRTRPTPKMSAMRFSTCRIRRQPTCKSRLEWSSTWS